MLVNGGKRKKQKQSEWVCAIANYTTSVSLFFVSTSELLSVYHIYHTKHLSFESKTHLRYVMIIFTHFLLPLLVHYCDCRGDSKLIFFNNPIPASGMRRLNSYLFSFSMNYSDDVVTSTTVSRRVGVGRPTIKARTHPLGKRRKIDFWIWSSVELFWVTKLFTWIDASAFC